MRARWWAAVWLLALASFAWAASWDDDSHYVSLGPRNGYYIVTPDSRLYRQLGLYEAPVIDTADRLHHGYGTDALAFRFNQNGVLIATPALHRTRVAVRSLTLRVEFSGKLFTVLFNGERLFEVEDETLKDAGGVGVWTKADSVTLFDDFAFGGKQ